jgi:hypothetical protein
VVTGPRQNQLLAALPDVACDRLLSYTQAFTPRRSTVARSILGTSVPLELGPQIKGLLCATTHRARTNTRVNFQS